MILRRALKRNVHQVLIPPAQCTRRLATEADIKPPHDPAIANDALAYSPRHSEKDEIDTSESGVKVVSQGDARARLAQELRNDGKREAYLQYQHRLKHTRSVGSDLAPYYIPQKVVNHPPWPKDITLELLLASQAHLGHKTTHWNPANSRYIFGIRQGIHVISLDVTAAHLRRACRVVTGVTERGGLVLFAGTRPGQQRFVTQAAYMAGGYHVFERWVSGAITNRNQILGSCKLKVVDHLDREISGQEDILRQEPALKPDLVVCLNPLENWVLLHECALEGIPTIGVIDTDANPTWVTYPIPANDDSLRCIQVIAGALGRAGQLGKMRRQEAAEQGNIIHATVSLETKRAESLAPAGGKPDDGKGDDEEEEGPALPVDDDVNLTEPAEELDAFVQQAEFMARIEEKAQSD